ncbi:MAG: thiamine phosphate synthase [Lactobacillus sp.]|jgi:thiamine-phosphate pyrophosphorylase|nr:thiamine phosphate synthase [Lactobacillus sp.]
MNFKKEMLQAYCIAGSQDLADHQVLPFLEKALKAGITTFQLREKGPEAIADPQKLVALAQACRQLTRQYDVPLFIDDNIDLALTVGADGVHVGQKDEGISSVLAKTAGKLMVGYSCNTPAQIEHANSLSGIDYLGVGAVYPTTSKADAGAAIGLAKLHDYAQLSTRPIVAIGGITVANAPDVIAAGAAGISGITIFTLSENLPDTVARLKSLDGGV